MPVGKVVIHHGERVTEHEIGEEPLVVGRDPNCDLFFADKKLSRRHARFERAGNRVKLVDLGSRNGSWVNEERIDEMLLAEGDDIRLGSLRVQFVVLGADDVEDEGESTILLAEEPLAEDSRTVVLSPESLPDTSPEPEAPSGDRDGGDPGTVLLPTTETLPPPPDTPSSGGTEEDDEDVTLQRDVGPSSDATVVLKGAAKRSDVDTGTVIFRGRVDPALESVTRLAPVRPAEPDEAGPPEASSEPSSQPLEDAWAEDTTSPARSLSLKLGLLAVAVAAFGVVILALPLMRHLGSELEAEANLHARALVDLLAATNESALEGGTPRALSLAPVDGAPHVVAAYILDVRGKLLAPAGLEGSPLLDELRESAPAIRTFRKLEGSDGAWVLMSPIRKDGRRLGVAVLRYRPFRMMRAVGLPLALGFALLVIGIGAALFLAHRFSLTPVAALKDDIEAFESGLADRLHEDRPYAELREIARSFNALVDDDFDGAAPDDKDESRPSEAAEE